MRTSTLAPNAWIRIYCCSIIVMEMPLSNSPRPTEAPPADRLGAARADLKQRYTTTWPDGTAEVVEETALEPHERALLDDPELHGALSESLANLRLATPLNEDLLDPSQYTPAEAFPPGEYLRDELDERGWTVTQFRGDDRSAGSGRVGDPQCEDGDHR